MPTYHDLHVTTEDIPRTSIFNLQYGLEVTCTRVGGWRLWRDEGQGRKSLVGGEYDEKWLVLDVDGHVIVDGRINREKKDVD